jgi:hypothetical protein
MGSEVILAIDPGPMQSAYVQCDRGVPVSASIVPNDELLGWLRHRSEFVDLAIEGIACYGMPVGKETFDTCIWIGRFIEANGGVHNLVYRGDVKMHLCRSMRAKDPMIRQALIDRFGPGKEKAIGTKKNPGPLYGIKSHCWSALAVAVTYCDTNRLATGATA